MTNDPIAEARRVLAETPTMALHLWTALSNLLSHVERLTAPVTGDRAELVRQLRATRECSVCDGYGVRERVDADPKSCGGCDGTGMVPVYYGIGERAAALLEADARREVALAGAIREIEEALNEWDGAERKLHMIRAICAKVADE